MPAGLCHAFSAPPRRRSSDRSDHPVRGTAAAALRLCEALLDVACEPELRHHGGGDIRLPHPPLDRAGWTPCIADPGTFLALHTLALTLGLDIPTFEGWTRVAAVVADQLKRQPLAHWRASYQQAVATELATKETMLLDLRERVADREGSPARSGSGQPSPAGTTQPRRRWEIG
jgi:hypothetical protein